LVCHPEKIPIIRLFLDPVIPRCSDENWIKELTTNELIFFLVKGKGDWSSNLKVYKRFCKVLKIEFPKEIKSEKKGRPYIKRSDVLYTTFSDAFSRQFGRSPERFVEEHREYKNRKDFERDREFCKDMLFLRCPRRKVYEFDEVDFYYIKNEISTIRFNIVDGQIKKVWREETPKLPDPFVGLSKVSAETMRKIFQPISGKKYSKHPRLGRGRRIWREEMVVPLGLSEVLAGIDFTRIVAGSQPTPEELKGLIHERLKRRKKRVDIQETKDDEKIV
jgi:hypothetical protein